MTLDQLVKRWTIFSSGSRSSEYGIGKQEGIREMLSDIRELEEDARIAELTAEVARYKDALVSIHHGTHEEWAESIARNALKEG